MSTLKDAVQPDAWYEALPRPQYSTLEQIPLQSDWFAAYRLPHDIIAIYEPHHFQEVISYLILGSEKTLMVDSGMGMFDIKAVAESLTDKPILLVNTHTHFDHIGGNHQFDSVYLLNQPCALNRLHKGVQKEEVISNFELPAFHYSKPLPFDLETFKVNPSNTVIPIEDGYVFNLGNRQIQLISTPGHSPDSIMLVCAEEKLLFTGDTIYPATLYAHISKSDGLNSDFETYRRTLHTVSKLYSDYTLFCSHNEPIRPGSMLTAVAEAFDLVADEKHPFALDESGLKKYEFDGFAIVTT